jgi:DMSO/TMAO reductase YedYZ molybdopterin-dependent catalytic subunit
VEVTPLEDMRVRTAEEDPVIDVDTYQLTVTGLVENPITLTFEDILAMDAEERLIDLPCVEGWTETATWKGPRLSVLLDMAGLLEEADNVVFISPGGYTTSLTPEDIEETDPLLAYEANGETLPHEQGYPLRLVVPDRLGYKWIKWVTGIEVISGEYEGFWESRGYPNEAEVDR